MIRTADEKFLEHLQWKVCNQDKYDYEYDASQDYNENLYLRQRSSAIGWKRN